MVYINNITLSIVNIVPMNPPKKSPNFAANSVSISKLVLKYVSLNKINRAVANDAVPKNMHDILMIFTGQVILVSNVWSITRRKV